MSRRRSLERHRRSLVEIREIMNSMKTLAHMEIRKLDRFFNAQAAVVESIEKVAADFLGFYPDTLPEVKPITEVYLLVGTERGFCGGFNQALVGYLEASLGPRSSSDPIVIAVGCKLHTLLQEDKRVLAYIEGANVVEEVYPVLNKIVSELTSLQMKRGVLALHGVYHETENGIVMNDLLPPFRKFLDVSTSPYFTYPPVLNLAPAEFLIELTDHYLFAVLHEVLYASLMAENRRRVAHLEEAVHHLNDKSMELARKCNALRQEEIIEEIEVILLSTVDGSEH